MVVITSVKARATTILEYQRFSRCYRCSEKIYIKPQEISDGYRTKLTAYNFLNNNRHYCFLDPVPYEKPMQAQATS